MKVTITSIYNRNCGIGQYSENLCNSLKSKVEDVVTYRKDDGDNQTFLTYPYRSFRSFQYHVAPYYLKKAISETESDIWHADYVSSYLALDWAKVKQPKIVTVHDAIPFHFSSKRLDFEIYKYQLKQAIKGAEYLITVSEAARKDLLSQVSIDPKKVVAIPNGMDTNAYNPALKRGNNEIFTIRYLGGLGAKHKNVSMLLHAAKLLEDKGLEFRLELGGYIPEQFFLKDLCKELNLKSVRFPGFIPDHEKAQFLAQADLFVFPSLIEGFGFPPMEAMASGTPVVASKIPVFEELLGDHALLAEPDPKSFADAISSMMVSTDLVSYYGEKGYLHVQNYTWDRAADQTLELYQNSLKTTH